MAIKIRRGTDSDRLAVIFEEGEVIYTTDTKSFFIGDGVTAGGNQIGGTTAAELLKTEVHNATGATLTAGQVVYLSGNTGNKPNAVLAKADAEATSSKTIGLIILNISNNTSGDIATDGLIGDLNTSAFAPGDLLWLSDSVAGGVTTIVPDTPNHAVFIGYVVAAHPTQGKILIHIQNGYELNELHDVKITSVQNNDGLIYDNTLGYWKNSNTVTVQGNTFNAANKLVQLDGTAKLPAVDGSQLTNLPTPATPTLASVTTAGNTTTNAITVGSTTVTYNNNSYLPGISITNTNSGISALSGVSFTVNGVMGGFMGYIPSNYILPAQASTMQFTSGGNNKLGFIANSNQVGVAQDIYFSTFGSNTTYQMQIKGSTGNIQIGTNTDAGYKLDVNGTARVQGNLFAVRVYSKVFREPDSDSTYLLVNWSGYTNNQITFGTPQTTALTLNAKSTGYTTIPNGNVLIGTTTDAGYKLDVNGTARISGRVILGSSAYLVSGSSLDTSVKISCPAIVNYDGASGLYISNGNFFQDFSVTSSASVLINAVYPLYQARQYSSLSIVHNIGVTGTPTSATYKSINSTQTVNQTLGTGKIWGLYINHTITAAADHTVAEFIQGTNSIQFIQNNSSSLIALNSTTKGFLPPRMTTTEKNAIATPAAGLVVYDTTDNKHYGYNGTTWNAFY